MAKPFHIDVPFYANTEDSTHCFQAMLRSVLKAYFPNKEYSWKELEELTEKPEGKWTWPMAAAIKLTKMGVEVRMVEDFDYERFASDGVSYLVELYGAEVATRQEEMSDIPQARKLAQELKDRVQVERRIPTISDLKECLQDGFIVSTAINSRMLDNEDGYASHSVILTGFDDTHVWLHDPGLPPIENRKVTWKTFEKAWYFPDKKAGNILAFRKR